MGEGSVYLGVLMVVLASAQMVASLALYPSWMDKRQGSGGGPKRSKETRICRLGRIARADR